MVNTNPLSVIDVENTGPGLPRVAPFCVNFVTQTLHTFSQVFSLLNGTGLSLPLAALLCGHCLSRGGNLGAGSAFNPLTPLGLGQAGRRVFA